MASVHVGEAGTHSMGRCTQISRSSRVGRAPPGTRLTILEIRRPLSLPLTYRRPISNFLGSPLVFVRSVITSTIGLNSQLYNAVQDLLPGITTRLHTGPRTTSSGDLQLIPKAQLRFLR